MITAIIASLVTIVLMYLAVKYWEKKKKKDLAKSKEEILNVLLDDFEKKIS